MADINTQAKAPGLEGQAASELLCPHCSQPLPKHFKGAPLPTLAQAEGVADSKGDPLPANPWSTRKDRQQAEARELLRPKGK